MTTQLLMVRAAETTFAVPVEIVIEVLSAVQPETIIDQPGSIEGLINLRGEIVAIHSLRTLSENPHRSIEPSDRILVLRNGDSKVGLIADEVENVQDFREEQLFAQSLSPTAFDVIQILDGKLSLLSLSDFMD